MERLKIVSEIPDLDTATTLRIWLLGPPRLALGEHVLALRGRPKLWPLLALIARSHGEPLARERAADHLWPDSGGAAARGNLRRHLSYLEAALPALGEPWLDRSATHIRWHPAQRVWVDANVFEQLDADDANLRAAVELYRGDFLDGIDDEWANVERERLRERYLAQLERLVAKERREGNSAAALRYVSAARRQEPYREDLVRSALRLHHEIGDRAGAVREYERFATLLHDELGTEPAPATTELYAALTATDATDAPAHDLPYEYTTFVGRESERALLAAMIGRHQIISVVGPPGIGKTRLAVHVARAIGADIRDGVRFIDCAAANDADTLLDAIAAGCDDRARARPEGDAPLEQRFRHKHVLLLLDDVENVARACAQVVARIARAAPGVRIVCTSRVVLDAAGEAVLRLDPLDDVDGLALFIDRARLARPAFAPASVAETLRTIVRATDGLPLALELAAGRLRTLSLGEIAARLQRPLAFLGDDAARADAAVRTLRTSLDASYALLPPDEKRLFRRLSVFAGGATVDLARRVCWNEVDERTVQRALSHIADHSLIVPPGVDALEGRYGMLQSIAEYARERLEADDDATAVRRAHAIAFAEHYAALNDDLRGPRAHAYFDALARDHDDLRNALRTLLEGGDADDAALAARLALALSRYWFDRGLVGEGARWLETALARPLAPALRAAVVHCLATLIRNQGNYQRLYDLFGEALALVRETGDDVAIGKALATYSNAARMVGAYDVAIEHADDAYAHFARTGDAYLCGYALMTSGCAAFSKGDLAAARAGFDAALAHYRRTEAEADIALALGNLALCSFYDGDRVSAVLFADEAATRAATVGNHYFHANAVLTLARTAESTSDARAHLGRVFELAALIDDKEFTAGAAEVAVAALAASRPHLAATLLGAIDAAREHDHAPRGVVEGPDYDRLSDDLRERLGTSVCAAAHHVGRRLSLDDAVVRIRAWIADESAAREAE